MTEKGDSVRWIKVTSLTGQEIMLNLDQVVSFTKTPEGWTVFLSTGGSLKVVESLEEALLRRAESGQLPLPPPPTGSPALPRRTWPLTPNR